MGYGKQPQDTVDLPDGWWMRLNDLCRSKWRQRGTRLDIYQFTGISQRSFATARRKNRMTQQLFARLTESVGFEDSRDLLHALGSEQRGTHLASPIPSSVSLRTQKSHPQWADFRDYYLDAARPWALGCRIETESPYFRFGFKLLGLDGRVFGDGSIKSHDPNLIVHVGRNNWDRPALRISMHDIFLTAYMGGTFVEEADRPLFRTDAATVLQIALTVDRSYFASLSVNGTTHFRQVVPPEVCRRIVMYAWGDREEFSVEVHDLAIRSLVG